MGVVGSDRFDLLLGDSHACSQEEAGRQEGAREESCEEDGQEVGQEEVIGLFRLLARRDFRRAFFCPRFVAEACFSGCLR